MRRIARGRVAASLLAIVALSAGMAACGDDDDESNGEDVAQEESAEEITLVATEYEFDLSATPTADTQSVTFDNQGEELHDLIFARINEGFTVEEAIEMEGEEGSATLIAQDEAKPGETVDIEIKKAIEPGSYAMLCPIGGKEGPHYELGQLQEFEIE